MKNLLTLLLFINLVLFSQKTNATNYYFSTSDGDDSRTTAQAQSSSTPWKTLSKLNSFFGSLQAGDNVYFKRGDVFYGLITITKASINFGAYGSGNKPVISGLTDVTGWTSVGSNLWESSAIPNAQSTAMIVTINGAYYTMGRYPNADATNGGYLTYESFSGINSITDNQLPSSPNWTGAEVVVRKATWVTDRGTISSHSGGTLVFTPIAGNNSNGVNGSGYFIQDDVRTLDQQGEWYYNPSTKKLTVYWPGTPPATQISTVTTVIEGSSKSSISFDNLVIKGSIGRMVNIPSSSNFTFTNCDFMDAGEDAIWCSSASNLDIENCTLTNSNNNGIVGTGLSTFTLKNTVANTTGVYAGMTNQRSNYSCEGFHVAGNNLTIQNNSVINTGFNGIFFQGNSISVKNNLVDTYCSVKGDGAGIYTWTGSGSSTTYTNRVVDGNIVINGIGATNGSPNPSNDALIDAGIYMDDFTQNVNVINNTIANCPKGLYLHNAYNLVVRNNTIYNNTYAGIVPRFDGGHAITNVIITANKVVQKSSSVVCYRYKSTSNDLNSSGSADSNYYARPMSDNTTMQTEAPGSTLYTLAQFQSSFSAREKNSKKSPKTITSAGDLRFEYNASSSSKVVNLGATYMDVTGASHAGSITLAPYTSAVLIYSSGTVANQAPSTNAGPDQVLSLPTNSTTLNGSASDPDGTIASYQWTKVSGPTQGTIGSPTIAKTVISNLAQGVYQFELKVTDNSGATAKDTVQITVNASANQAPVANAGSTQVIVLPVSAVVLDGSRSADADGTISSYQWTKVLGPSSALILTPTIAVTTVTTLGQGVYQFELKVTDNLGATGRDTVTVTVSAPVNQLPSANAGSDINITLPLNTTSLNGSGSDPDGSISSYQWTKVSGPSQYNIVSATQAQTTINNLTTGVYKFELKVTDNSGAIDRDTLQVTVNAAPPNQAPTAVAGPDINITLPVNTATLNGSATDPDGTISSYQWTKIFGPSQYSIQSASQSQTSITNLAQGTYQFELKVTDNDGAIDRDTLIVIVNAAPNQSPTADAGGNQAITLPNAATLNGSGNDPDGTITSYQWTKISGPSGFTIVSPNKAQTVVNNLAPGTYQFQLTVTDNSGAAASDVMTLTVNAAPNQLPTADAGSDISITLPVNSATLIGDGNDPDGNIASYQWAKISGPSQYSIVSSDQPQTIVNNLTPGTYQFQLTVTDNSGAAANDVMTLIVNAAPNQLPTADAGADITITLPTNSVTLNGDGNDPDGNIISYNWTKVSGPLQYQILSGNQQQTTITNLAQGTYRFTLKVTDNAGATGRDTVIVIVNSAPNQPPTVDAGPDITITLPANSVTLNGNADDPDGNIMSYDWTKISGPSQFDFSSTTRSRTNLSNLAEGVYQFELTVTDNSGATTSDIVEVTVNPAPQTPNELPLADAGADIIITLPVNNITLNGGGTDPDGTITSYQWTNISGPSQFNIVSDDQPQTVVNNLLQGNYEFALTVTDNNGAIATDTVIVTVNPGANQSPVVNAGSDVNITLPANSITFNASANDPDGNIASSQWTKISGPSQYNIVSATQLQTIVDNLLQGVYQFELEVTDNQGAIQKDTVTVIVNAAINQAPSADAGQDITITLPVNSITLAGSANDVDGTITSYQWSRISGPFSYTIADASQTQTAVNNLAQGVYQFVLTATDNNGAAGKDTVSVTVIAAANQPPTANAGQDITITLPVNTVTLNGTGSDPDGTVSSYQWTKVSGPFQYNMGSGNQSQTTVRNLAQGVYKFELKVRDNSGAISRDTVAVTVNPDTNVPPVANAGSDITTTLPSNSVTLNGSATDPNGTVTSYQWTKVSGPTRYGIISPSKARTTINNLAQGIYKFKLMVTDNAGATGADTVQVTVNAAGQTTLNQAPTANAGTDITISLPVNNFTLNGSGSDADGTIAAYSWSKISGPSQYNIVSATQAQTAVNNLVQGVYQFELTVTDNKGATGKDTINVTVTNTVNQLPTANAGIDMNITLPLNSVLLNGTGSDPDGVIAFYQWTKISGPSQYNIISANQSQTTVNNLAVGIYRFVLRVTDDRGGIARDTVQVVVNAAPPNQAPTADAGVDINITLPTNSAALPGSGTDPDGVISSYQWTKVSGPAQYNLVSANQAQATINSLVQGIYKFELRVTDNRGAIGRDTITVTVNAAPNQSPKANAGSDITITLPVNSVQFNGSGTDADGTIASYQWTKISGPSSYNIVSPTRAQTTTGSLVQGVYIFELRVTDNQGATARDTITVIVNAAPNQSPVAKAGSDITITLPVNSAQVNGSGTDADGTIASYQWTKISGPAQYTIVSAAQAQTTITTLAQGVYTFELKVTDNQGATGRDTITVVVNAAPNQSPVAKAGSDITITLPVNSAQINGSGTDADGTIASYQWTKISGPAQYTIVSATQAQTTITTLAQGVYTFELKVTDNLGATGKDTVQITINAASQPANKIPTANAGSDITITLPIDSVQVNGGGTDADGTIASYQWTKISGPSQYTIVSATQAQTIIDGLVKGVYTFELKVTDNLGATGKDTVKITVNAASQPVNYAPTANAGDDIDLTLPVTSAILAGSGTDSDGTIASYKWTNISGPAGFTMSSSTDAQTTVSDLSTGEYEFELTVTDDKGATGKDTVKITVNEKLNTTAKIFPNPTTNQINIKIHSVSKTNNTSMRIYDSRGTLVYQENFTRTDQNMTKQVDVTKLMNGVYYVEMNVDPNKIMTLMFVKQ